MSYHFETPMGLLQAVIDDNCGLKKFYSIANLMAKDLKIKFSDKDNDPNIVEWHFKYKGRPLTLQFDVYNGVSIFPKEGKHNKYVTELAGYLQGKSF